MKTIILIFLSGIYALTAFAQFTVETNYGTILDDNIDNNYLHISDRIASGSLKTGYGWSSEQTEIGLFYTGSINYYSQIIDRSFYTHRMNFDYERRFGEEDASTFTASTGFSTRLDRGDYTIYDHQIYDGTLQLQHFFTEMLKGEGVYAFNYVRFSELPVFNYTEHVLSTEGAAYFSTKTTLIARANIGMKKYSSANYDLTTASSGMGRGRNKSSKSTPSVTQLIGIVKVGQSIFENTGLSFTAQYQWNIQKESRYLSSEYDNISDDAIFDDHYGYEGLQLSGMLTQVISSDIRIRLVGSIQNKLYSNLAAYDLADNIISGQRSDTRTTMSLQFTKEFESLGITLNATYDYIVNDSNDSFYHYTNNAFSIGLSIPFLP
jgi:hypothetical protein